MQAPVIEVHQVGNKVIEVEAQKISANVEILTVASQPQMTSVRINGLLSDHHEV